MTLGLPRNRLQTGVALLVLLASCSPAPAAGPTPEASAGPTLPASTTPKPGSPTSECAVGETWTVGLSVTGGFAGVDQHLDLDQTGAYTAADLRQDRNVEGFLPPETVADVAELLPTVCDATGSERLPPCADCFTYSLEVLLNQSRYSFVANDVSLSESPAAELTGLMNQLLSSALES